MPRLWTPRRLRLLAMVVGLILVQGIAAAIAAFATRDLFVALHAETQLPVGAMIALVLSGFAIGLSRVLARLRGERIGQSYALEVRAALFEHEAAMAHHDVALRRRGYTALRFVGDLTAIRNWPSRGLPRLAAAIILLPATLTVLGLLNLQFLVGTAPVLALGLLAITLGGLWLPSRHERLRQNRSRIAADMSERMPIAPMLSALGRSATEKDRIITRSHRMIEAALNRLRLSETLKAVPDVLAGILALIVIWFGFRSGASTANIAAGLAAIGISLRPARDLATVWNHFSAFKVAQAKCASSLRRPKRQTMPGRLPLPSGAVSLRISDLSAGPIKGLSCSVAAGSVVLLEGSAGSGKSLLFSIISGLDRPGTGAICLSGHPLEHIKPASLRRSVALVTATPPILKGSVRRALTLGIAKRPSDDEIMKAATLFGLSDLISERGGLDAKIAEGGRDLSDGQRVRIALVRLWVTSPGLIMIDAIAEHLDADCRMALLNSIETSGATVLAVDASQSLGLCYTQKLALS